MKILGIETSCDDTSCAVVKNGTKVLTNIVSSQTEIHRKYRGIVPELASRRHLENINCVVEAALAGAGKIDAVAVTVGPGLIGSLLVGTTTAFAVSEILKIPLIGVNHIEGHMFSNRVGVGASGKNKQIKYPHLAIIISGGHTDLILTEGFGKYITLGRTRDDAVGEVFDKIAKYLGLGYPGGPVIDKLAKKGDASKIRFPRPYMPGSWDFSFSGLKTAVINYADKFKISPKSKPSLFDLCAAFQQSCADVVVRKTLLAAETFGIKHILLGGGVSSNSLIRSVFAEKCREKKIVISMPSPEFCTDNAAMIASAGYFKFRHGSSEKAGINPLPNMELNNWN